MQQENEQIKNQEQGMDPKQESEQTLHSLLGGDIPHVDTLRARVKGEKSTAEVESDLVQKDKQLLDTKQEIESLLQGKEDSKDLGIDDKIKLHQLAENLLYMVQHRNYDAGDLEATQGFWENAPGMADSAINRIQSMKKAMENPAGSKADGTSFPDMAKSYEILTPEDRGKLADAMDKRVKGFEEYKKEIPEVAEGKRFTAEEKGQHITNFNKEKASFQRERMRIGEWLAEVKKKFLPQ